MLHIDIPGRECWDDDKQEFVVTKPFSLSLEHSLVSVSKWEAKWQRSFMSKPPKTIEEVSDYVKCMTLTQNVPAETYACLTKENLDAINKYIEAPMTATTFNDFGKKGATGSRQVITSELIYFWMITYGIPFECQKWHLNRLMTLIRVCAVKNAPPKKMSRSETLMQNTRLNAARRQMLNSRG